MSHFLDRLTFFRKKNVAPFSDGHGILTRENRDWEDAYRTRWQHDKIVRSTHGNNCTGGCSWKIYVKGGIITWETQQTDYPRTRPELPNHEPRGCQRGASYSWAVYGGNRLKYPLVRGRLVRLWREARKTLSPVDAWKSIQQNPEKRQDYISVRGLGGFVRTSWDEANEIVAAANIYTVKTHGPDRISGFSPIPAMSMISYAAGSRYLSLIGGNCLSFYDWYCDLPVSSPQVWGEQTDVPESADWYTADFIMAWGSNVPQTRTPDAHFFTEARYKGTKTVAVTPDYSEVAKLCDMWMAPKQGTDAALGMALGHVILKEFHIDRKAPYFEEYCRSYTDMPFLVRLKKQGGRYVPERFLRASDFPDGLGQVNNPEWKTLAVDEASGDVVAPNGTAGFRWGDKGKWNLELKDGGDGHEIKPALSLIDRRDAVVTVGFPYFACKHPNEFFAHTDHPNVLDRAVPVRSLKLGQDEVHVATVFDLLVANYGIDRGLGGGNVAASFDDDVPYTPAWQEKITGVPRHQVLAVARDFASTAEKTKGRCTIIIGAAMNHWYHSDMNYRAVINMLTMCGCVGKPGGGWAHYVGQEKLRPQPGWIPLAFGLDWHRPPRQMNATSFFYAHTDQWRYERLPVNEILSPTAEAGDWSGSFIDYNVRAERMGWLPSAPQLGTNSLEVGRAAKASGMEAKDYVASKLKSGELKMACEDPDSPANWPRNFFVWRGNLLGSSGKGHEYFLKHLLGAQNGVLGQDIGARNQELPQEVVWHPQAPEGKVDLWVNIEFRMTSTGLYSDVILPTATWYEKNDINTTDMHPFVHPLTAAVDPVWETRSDWDIFKGLAEKFSELTEGQLGTETDVVLLPLMHDSPSELGQALDVKEWKKGECDPIPGKTMPHVIAVERDYANTYKKFTSFGPLLDKLGNNSKGINWNTDTEIALLREVNGVVEEDGVSKGRPRIVTDLNAIETILLLSPETNGHVAVKSWEALEKSTGRHHAHLAASREDEKIRFHDIVAQPRKIISSPTWSGIESEKVSYNAGYTNVHELIPWRTLTGRQQFYQDHKWMRAFGETLCVYKPPVATRTLADVAEMKPNGNKAIPLNFITPHQKWSIHSTHSDNLIMLTLNRGGPCIWINEEDAKSIGVEDNDWVEGYNVNGALTARAVVSQRLPRGMVMMYHAQEKHVNTPGSEVTGIRGGIHNSVTRIMIKPTHMIGGYVQQAYGFNYYGTTGVQRDEFLLVRKMNKIDWMDGPLGAAK